MDVAINTEITRYMHDIVTFLRMHRAVAGGMSPRGTKHLELFAKCLAVLHGLDFVTPSIVALAARKVYRHRLQLINPSNERSLQYGSSVDAVAMYLEGVTAETVIEDVLSEVEVPL